MSKTVIQVENLSKAYQIGQIGSGTLTRDLERFWATKIRGKEDPFLIIGETNDRSTKGESDIVWSLKDINFQVDRGDAIGIIGKNGAGKSTLLKLLSRITSPTTGTTKVKGRIASLLEVGTGFHPELSGRENIYLNGAILGMRKKEIDKKFDEIVDFSGVERYIDTPVKRYSSGMYVRLAFAVAAHLESEILIVDEVLAVGDAEFQKKCLGKMGDISKGEGRTVLFVSHNMAAIQNLCNKSMLLTNGTIHSIDDTKTIISNYLSLNSSSNQDKGLLNLMNRKGNGDLEFTRISLIDDISNTEISDIQCGTDVRFRLYFDLKGNDYKNIVLAIGINNEYDERITFLSNEMINKNIELSDAGSGFFDILVHKMPLTEGRYNLTLFCSVNGIIADWIQHAYYFNIVGGDFYNTGKNVPDGNGNILLNYSI